MYRYVEGVMVPTTQPITTLTKIFLRKILPGPLRIVRSCLIIKKRDLILAQLRAFAS